MQKPLENSRYKFTPGAMVIVQMGEELIGHPSTAIGELVKNAYDADATSCYVYIHADEETARSFLIIHDTGLGMSADTLFGDWLRPSVSSKRGTQPEARKSAVFERSYLGSKGIGRLAAMALGRYLTVVSRTSNESEYNWLKLDRAAFRQDEALENITFPGGKTNSPYRIFSEAEPFGDKSPNPTPNHKLTELLQKAPFRHFKEGTLIVLEELDESVLTIVNDESNDSTLEIDDTTFLKSLRELITPLELNRLVQNELVDLGVVGKGIKIAKADSTFEVWFGASGISCEDKHGNSFLLVAPVKVLENYDYRVLGVVTREGKVNGRYICSRLDDFPVDEPFVLEPEIVLMEDYAKGPSRRELESIPEELQHGEVGAFFFDIRVYDRDEDAITKLEEALKTSNKRKTRQTLDRYLGLRISKNGFQVKPYGEEDKDWMNINMLRVQNPAGVIGINQILGYTFFYSPENDGLSEKTNREGFFENKAFITFKKELRAILGDIGKRRYLYRQIHGLGRPEGRARNNRPDTASYLQFVQSQTADKKLIESARRFVQETNTALDNLQTSLTFSQRLASLGSGLELVYHELSQPITQIGGVRSALGLRAERITDSGLRTDMLTDIKSLRESVKTLNTLRESLQPAIGKATPKDFKPAALFTKICYLYANDFADSNISALITPAADSFVINNYEYVFWIAFLNIVNNAVYWLRTVPVASKTEQHPSEEGAGGRLKPSKEAADGGHRIVFDVQSERIIIRNNGPAIANENLEAIFEYGVTTRKEKNATGLGLSFTKSNLILNGWDITAENTPEGPSFLIAKQDESK